MMKNRISFSEIAWLTAAFLVLLTAIHSTVSRGWKESLLLYLFLIVTIIMFILRRNNRLSKKLHTGN
jgi:uncharacterized membrane protein